LEVGSWRLEDGCWSLMELFFSNYKHGKISLLDFIGLSQDKSNVGILTFERLYGIQEIGSACHKEVGGWRLEVGNRGIHHQDTKIPRMWKAENREQRTEDGKAIRSR
jgi:hypothetical protein